MGGLMAEEMCDVKTSPGGDLLQDYYNMHNTLMRISSCIMWRIITLMFHTGEKKKMRYCSIFFTYTGIQTFLAYVTV